MLGKRSRPLQKNPSKVPLMPDYLSDSSDHSEEKSKFFNAPRIFIGFSSKGSSDSEVVRSPTSPLDIKTFSGVGISSYWYEKQVRSPRSGLEGLQCVSPRPWEKRDSEGIGLGIVVALHSSNEANNGGPALSGSRGPLLGSQLKISIGSNTNLFSAHKQLGSPKAQISSPHTHSNSRHAHLKSPQTHLNSGTPLSSFSGKQSDPIPIVSSTNPSSESGMEHSESYTCITSHGPKSSTRRIYNHNSIECETIEIPAKKSQQDIWNVGSPPSPRPRSYGNVSGFPTADFLSACYLCKRQLSHGKDIFMYRGDKAFCSVECRYQQILMDERSETFPASPPSSTGASQCGRIFSTSNAAAA